jgi:hypothetical protein
MFLEGLQKNAQNFNQAYRLNFDLGNVSEQNDESNTRQAKCDSVRNIVIFLFFTTSKVTLGGSPLSLLRFLEKDPK